jgi:hypothetical protein
LKRALRRRRGAPDAHLEFGRDFCVGQGPAERASSGSAVGFPATLWRDNQDEGPSHPDRRGQAPRILDRKNGARPSVRVCGWRNFASRQTNEVHPHRPRAEVRRFYIGEVIRPYLANGRCCGNGAVSALPAPGGTRASGSWTKRRRQSSALSNGGCAAVIASARIPPQNPFQNSPDSRFPSIYAPVLGGGRSINILCPSANK